MCCVCVCVCTQNQRACLCVCARPGCSLCRGDGTGVFPCLAPCEAWQTLVRLSCSLLWLECQRACLAWPPGLWVHLQHPPTPVPSGCPLQRKLDLPEAGQNLRTSPVCPACPGQPKPMVSPCWVTSLAKAAWSWPRAAPASSDRVQQHQGHL